MTRRIGIILAGMLTVFAGAEAIAQTAGVDIPPYPGSVTHRMGGLARVNGREVRAYYFTTKVPQGQVAEFYSKKWNQDGQIVSVSKTSRGGLAVGYVDLGTGETRTVALWRDEGVTYGFPAIVKGMAPPFLDSRTEVGGVPIHPGSEGLMTYENLERGGVFQTISYSDRASLLQNESFYLKTMGARGWELIGRHRAEKAEESVMLDFAKGNRKISVTLAWMPKHLRCSVFIVTNFCVKKPGGKRP